MESRHGWVLAAFAFALASVAIVLIALLAGRGSQHPSDTSSPSTFETGRIAPSTSPKGEGNTLEVRVVDQDTLAFRSPSFG